MTVSLMIVVVIFALQLARGGKFLELLLISVSLALPATNQSVRATNLTSCKL